MTAKEARELAIKVEAPIIASMISAIKGAAEDGYFNVHFTCKRSNVDQCLSYLGHQHYKVELLTPFNGSFDRTFRIEW